VLLNITITVADISFLIVLAGLDLPNFIFKGRNFEEDFEHLINCLLRL
jgi:hypothetical protein